MADKQIITADLSGLKLSAAQYKTVQDAVHRIVLTEVARLPAFTGGIGVRPLPGGTFPKGIILDRLKNLQGIGP